jgi:hypothetical protein
MPTVETAATAAAVFAALYASHMVGDHIVQSARDAEAKAAPRPGQVNAGVHPWRGWPALVNHIFSYTAGQAVTLLFVALTVVPLTFPGAVAALAISASTHAVIDRRWLVWRIIHAKRAHEWEQGPYAVDQSLHIGVLLVAAVLAGAVTAAGGAVAVTAAGLALVAAAMAVEQLRARRAAGRAGDPTRL